MAFWRRAVILVLWPMLFGLFLEHAVADGGVVLDSREINGLRVTVFGSPAPLRAGPADISLLLQEGERPVLDAEVSFRWTATISGKEWLPPCCSMKTGDGSVSAIRGHARNRLLYSAILAIPSSGLGKLDVEILQGQEPIYFTLDLKAAPAPAPVLAYWPWLAMTPLAILLFALHQKITNRRPSQHGASSPNSRGRAPFPRAR